MSKSKLALLGGKKTINKSAPHFSWPIITSSTKQVVLKQLNDTISIYNRSGIIEEFEEKFAKLHNKKYALSTSSGTAALHSLFFGFKCLN